MAKANLTLIRSILHYHILHSLRDGARSADYVRVMSGASKREIETLVRRRVIARSLEDGKITLHLSRVGEVYLLAANALLVPARAIR